MNVQPDQMYGSPSAKIQRPHVYREGRVCHFPGWRTRLSVYNADTRCYVHRGSSFSGILPSRS